MKFSNIRKRESYFVMAFLFQAFAFLMMMYDPEPHGFGVMTLWIGTLFLLVGLILPVFGMTKFLTREELLNASRDHQFQLMGFTIAFSTSLVTYIVTLEPTASLWDCSEMIASVYKLQVPHTPGTPLTLLLGRVFTMLALDDVSKVAWYVNFMSATFSAGAVGFTFLLIWHFGRSFFENRTALFVGGLGGALCLAFSDSFWFSAVEAETYGPSIFFMVLLIWLSIGGDRLKTAEQSNRIRLLAYLTGLSYCIHPMCILVLPVCFLIWKDPAQGVRWKSIAVSFGLGVVAILFISKVIAVDLFEWIFQLDLLLVNHLSFPFYSGLVLFILIVTVLLALVWKKYKPSRLVIASVLLVIAGFTPYLMLFVRSAKQPTINEFTPNNLAKIKPYMNRESYPTRPLLHGPYFDAQLEAISPKAKSYLKGEESYQEVGELLTYDFEDERMTILPRIYSNEERHIETYRQWTGLSIGEKARFSHNMKFMFKYQLGHMYGRYLLWNFAGRAGDVQHSAWLAPWRGFSDRSAIGYDKASNQYLMLPFLFGLLGLLIQSRRDKKGFVTLLSFFLITGILLVVYLNGTPNEPRERDYIYVGSYVAFSMWIGLGMIGFTSIFQHRYVKNLCMAISLAIPALMFYQNLDDHNRSGRTFQIDNARNILGSCEKGAVLFTGGDNDTFPLWYLQEVEGYRTDVRVMVMTYFNADWYINQLSRKYYDSPAFHLTLKSKENQYGPFDPLYIQEVMDTPISWGKYMEALKAENAQLKMPGASGGFFYYLPSRQLRLTTGNKTIELSVKGNYFPKSELAILDLLYSNGWERPIYFNFTALNGLNIEIQEYLSQEGLLYKLTPEKRGGAEIHINKEKSYRNLIELADYSNLSSKDTYFNYEDFEARMIAPLKFNFNQLIGSYLDDNNVAQASEVAAFVYDKLYFEHLQPSYADVQLGSILSTLGRAEESNKLINRTFLYFHDKLARQLKSGKPVSQNDLIVFHQAAMQLRDASLIQQYEILIEQFEN